MPGGDLHLIWKPYELYGSIDWVYSREAYDKKDGWGLAQSMGNVAEVLRVTRRICRSSFQLTSPFSRSQ
jgi:hypothetical protein